MIVAKKWRSRLFVPERRQSTTNSTRIKPRIRRIIPIKSSARLTARQIIYYHRFLRCKSIRAMLTRAWRIIRAKAWKPKARSEQLIQDWLFPSCPSTLIPLSILFSMKPRARLRGIYIYHTIAIDESITMIQSLLWMCLAAKTRVSLLPSLSVCVLFKHWKCSVAITRTVFPWATLRLKIDFERGWCDKVGCRVD